MIVSLIAAASRNHVIGKHNKLLWNLPQDTEWFKKTTMGHVVIMGRKTYESIPPKFRPLPGRTNMVITRQANYPSDGCVVAHSLNEALELARERGETEVFVTGGGEIYVQALPLAHKVYLTRVQADFEGDAYFPILDPAIWIEVFRDSHPSDLCHAYPYEFLIYERAEVKPE